MPQYVGMERYEEFNYTSRYHITVRLLFPLKNTQCTLERIVSSQWQRSPIMHRIAMHSVDFEVREMQFTLECAIPR